MTDNRIVLDKGYLLNLEILDFPSEYWHKCFIEAALISILMEQ
jgi:hypothetical protein